MRSAVAAPVRICNGTFKNNWCDAALKSDRESAKQPTAKRIEHSTEDQGTCRDNGKTNESFNASATDDPIEHLDGIEWDSEQK
ncbi:hypothetical protein HNQ36_000881 [Afipia massiliensis]|uniref:Uncharacterized protein n=1 Tax=Afipia massiliensis TaxID=211460 RepID=A0A840MSJ7_9BRAD|nr:hypothetical protein [Afipia massiliensis]